MLNKLKIGELIVEHKDKTVVKNQHLVATSSRKGLIPQSQYYGDSRIAKRDNVGFNIVPHNAITYRNRSDDGVFTFNINETGETLCVSKFYPVFFAKESMVTTEFLQLLLNSMQNKYSGLSVGTSQKVLSITLLKKISVSLPSLEEQRRIAGILSTWEKAINAYDRLIALKENQKHGVAQIMFSNVIDEVSFADVIDVTIGGTPSRANDLYWDKDKSTDNRWISIANMNSSFISDSTEYISDEGVKKSNVKLLPEGTVIFSFKLSLGKKAILEKACYTNEAIAGLVIKDDASLSRDYLFHALDFVDVNREIDQAVKGKTLNKTKLLRLKLPIMPLEEQQKVARVLNCAQKEIALLERKRDLLIKQKQGLMQQLLA